ncbi:hypothetical protein ACFWUW_20280 [Streptomyces sp. NPDC058655]|uniref:hypothetical protein n=1 Tax=unclassified Streptomyces TaxID=2593676 RepID=UPI00364D5CAB
MPRDGAGSTATALPSGSHTARPVGFFLAAAGLGDAEDVDLTDPDFVEWRGAGPEAWDPSR